MDAVQPLGRFSLSPPLSKGGGPPRSGGGGILPKGRTEPPSAALAYGKELT